MFEESTAQPHQRISEHDTKISRIYQGTSLLLTALKLKANRREIKPRLLLHFRPVIYLATAGRTPGQLHNHGKQENKVTNSF